VWAVGGNSGKVGGAGGGRICKRSAACLSCTCDCRSNCQDIVALMKRLFGMGMGMGMTGGGMYLGASLSKDISHQSHSTICVASWQEQ